MAITFWNTLAVESLDRAKSFYSALGFSVGPMPGGAGLVVSPDSQSMVCLFTKEVFRGLIPGELCDSHRSQELIQSLGASSREGVDTLIAKAIAAGGRALGQAKEQPYGYGGGFSDPDGHVWAVLWLAQGG